MYEVQKMTGEIEIVISTFCHSNPISFAMSFFERVNSYRR